MTAARIASYVFLAIALVAFVIQAVAFRRMLHGTSATVRALRRTQASRVTCAALYVAVGINTLVTQLAVLAVTLAVFATTQCIWMANAALDVRLRRSLPPNDGTPPQ